MCALLCTWSDIRNRKGAVVCRFRTTRRRAVPAPIGRRCCAVTECYGLLLYCNTFSLREIRVITESLSHAHGSSSCSALVRRDVLTCLRRTAIKTGNQSFVITDPDKLARIFGTYGLGGDRMNAHHLNLGVLEDECCRQSFLRGAFLAGGSVIDTAKRYQLGSSPTTTTSAGRRIRCFWNGLRAQGAARKGNFITYSSRARRSRTF
jgi:hypothetical protein